MSSTDRSTDAGRFDVLPLHRDPVVRAGIIAALREHAIFDVLEEAAAPRTGTTAVIVADYKLALQWIDASPARASILVLTSSDSEVDIRRAVEAGVHGYLLLGGPLSELVEAVTALAQGQRYLGRSVAERMADSLMRPSLTARETDVLQLLADGQRNKVIARELHIEPATVKTHVAAILSKLAATSRTHAASIGLTRGLVRPRPAAAAAYAPRGPRFEATMLPN